MSKTEIKVGKDLMFSCRAKAIVSSNEALSGYAELSKEENTWLQEDSSMPIFFDTNVLLNMYDISPKERDSFIQFLQKNKSRVYISSQVQREYLRHRVLQIRGVKNKISQIKSELGSTLDGLESIIDKRIGGLEGVANRSVVKYGMPKTYEALQKIVNSLSTEDVGRLKGSLAENKKNAEDAFLEESKSFNSIQDFEYSDPLLNSISALNVVDSLDEKEQKAIIEKYKYLRENFDNAKEGWAKENLTFPGSGDNIKPVDAPIDESVAWADLYIYCEIIKFMKQNDTHALFITRDVAKGDWLKKDTNQPFAHYIVNAFEQTGKLLIIKNSDNYLPLVTEPFSQEATSSIALCGNDDSNNEIDNIEVSNNRNENSSAIDSVIEGRCNIDLSNLYKKVFSRFTVVYRDISEEEFLSELKICSNWANSYGAGYVSEPYFIYDILGQKQYKFSSSKEVLEKLKSQDKVKSEPQTHDGHIINCLLMVESE